ncbi:MAG: methylenetetrahydrofolate--tRNA-(uracil(54)-C(5))-methyltransferase (FADH(2)-oxidizing) TrmFO [Coriobacteriia bacterium]|nr:methylenetetrahydrofolate--tRNA-(uracil(54)-C(5))-methyltransferase (FADH(2)-oxidizing) TrmFO [Coriobacteriia bacterium]
MNEIVNIIGGGLAGSEAALQLAARGINVNLIEMRPHRQTPVHTGGGLAELVCSNSLKSMKPDKPAGMLKHEMAMLGSQLIACACDAMVPAGGALAVDRVAFSDAVGRLVDANESITRIDGEAVSFDGEGVTYVDPQGSRRKASGCVTIIATGPLTSDALADHMQRLTGMEHMAFFDAAAPIVMADSLDDGILFRQSRYGDEGAGDYLNAPFNKEEYERFIEALLKADRVIARDFETRDLFSACQPIEEIARRGFDAPRHGMMKPVGLTDPRTGRRPYAAVQLRAEDANASSYNLVGFQTNLTFPAQRDVFRLIPGLEHAEFARYGVMHRNTFIDAPALLDTAFRLKSVDFPLYFAGQVSGTEGYCEAIMSGLYVALNVYARLRGISLPSMPTSTAFGSLVAYATSPETRDYQPMHVNFGVYPPLEQHIKNKGARYRAFTERECADMGTYVDELASLGIVDETRLNALKRWHDALAMAGMAEEP